MNTPVSEFMMIDGGSHQSITVQKLKKNNHTFDRNNNKSSQLKYHYFQIYFTIVQTLFQVK